MTHRRAWQVLTVLYCTSGGLQTSAFTPVRQQSQLTDTISQTSIPYDRFRTGGDPLAKLPFDDPRLADTSGGLTPSQVNAQAWQGNHHACSILGTPM